ncbi:hypothetical protein Aab01nite_80790 [Paractinoplanes abujensis]|nr:hypothetical protein Aab01nite_80790 [Actinoplanes abujensis]
MSRGDGHGVHGSVVFGDVIQVSAVKGSVNVGVGRPLYRITGAAPAQLNRDQAQRQPSRLLLARYGVVPFAGRAEELAAAAAWLADETPTAVRLLHAGGGQGKTRLAGEITARCAAQGWTVWRAGHAPGGGRASKVELTSAPVLVVVDYADRWPLSVLESLLLDLNELGSIARTTMRVLCLARSHRLWWSSLTSLIEHNGIESDDRPLGTLTVDRAGDILFTEAATRFAAMLGVDRPGWTPPDGFDARQFRQILGVHMAALAAVEAHRHGDRAPVEPHAVSAYLLGREYAYWYGRDRDQDARAQSLQRATCTAYLAGPLAEKPAQEALLRVGLAAREEAARRLLDDHRDLYPPEDDSLVFEPLAPDRLGEDLIALSTPGHRVRAAVAATDDWTLGAVRMLLRTVPEPPVWAPVAVTRLVETARRWPHVATEMLYPILRQAPMLAVDAGGVTLSRLAEIPVVDADLLETIEAHLPEERPIDLDVAAAAISTTLTDHRLGATVEVAERAQLHHDHAWRMSETRQREAAAEAGRAAADLYRWLAGDDPLYCPDLVESLDSLGWFLADVHRLEEALAVAQEAVQVARQLVARRPDEFEPHLARSLTLLCPRHTALGQAEAAVAAAEEAVGIYRSLAERDPYEYLPRLAPSLSTLGLGLTRDDERALALTRESVDIYRRLLADERTEFRPELADTLDKLGLLQARLGRDDQALTAYREAVALYEGLSGENPTRHLPSQAAVLTHLQNALAVAGRRDESLAVAEQAVEICGRAARANPAYRSDLADALSNLGFRLRWLGRPAHALAHIEAAVDLYRQLASRSPGLHLPGLAAELVTQSEHLIGAGRWDRALRVMREAVHIHRRLAADGSATAVRDLARCLAELAAQHGRRGQAGEALVAADETVALFRGLAARSPETYLMDLAISLRALGEQEAAAGRVTATESLQAAVDIGRGLAGADPDHLGELARSLEVLRDHLAARDGPRARALGAEAVRIHRRLGSAAAPVARRTSLLDALEALNDRLAPISRHVEALAVVDEMIGIHRQLVAGDPVEYGPGLAGCLMTRGHHLRALDRREETLACYAEAADLYRQSALDPPLAKALDILTFQLEEWNRWAAALPPLRELVAVRRRLAADDQGTYAPEVPRSLLDLSSCLGVLHRPGEALGPAGEAVRLYQQLAAADPDRYLLLLAQAEEELAGHLDAAGRRDEAIDPLRAAVRIHRRLHRRTDLARGLGDLGRRLGSQGQWAQAEPLLREAVHLFEILTGRDPRHRPALARCLTDLGNCFAALYGLERSRPITQRAAALRRQ